MTTVEALEVSSSYRSSRRNTSVLCAIGIAWAAAQLEFTSLSLGSVGEVTIQTASIPIIVAIMCLYSMARSTIEYMMQADPVRRWSLAQVDYVITLYIVRFTVVCLTASAIARTWETVLYIAAAFLIAVVSFFLLSAVLMLVMMPFRMWIRARSGRSISAASAAFEATTYSFFFSGCIIILVLILFGFNVITPFEYLGESYSSISPSQLMIFSSVAIIVTVSFFFDLRFFKWVFAHVPATIETSRYEDGQEIFTLGPNPAHPDYEEFRDEAPLVYTKIQTEGEEKG